MSTGILPIVRKRGNDEDDPEQDEYTMSGYSSADCNERIELAKERIIQASEKARSENERRMLSSMREAKSLLGIVV